MNDEAELDLAMDAIIYEPFGTQDRVLAKQKLMAWHTRKLKEAVREEWALISEVAHSANITAELFISKAREDRLAELSKE